MTSRMARSRNFQICDLWLSGGTRNLPRKFDRRAITAHELCLVHTRFVFPEAHNLDCFVRLHELRDI